MPSPTAAILAVGTELLGTERLDTNSLRLTAVLERYGLQLVEKGVVGDDEALIAARMKDLLTHHAVVLVTGGLGPTADDVTREAAAAALGLTLSPHAGAMAALEARYAAFQRVMPEVNRRQALVPEGAEVIPNPRGTAPGLHLTTPSGASLWLFPGVPVELFGMIESHLEPWLAARCGGVARETAAVKIACVPESEVEERITPAYTEFGREVITILSKPGEILLRATADGPEGPRRARLQEMTDRLAELVGPAVFSRQEFDTLEAVVGRLLLARGETVVTAESCTGGLVAERFTAVAGSSAYFLGGAVTYSNELKQRLLGVSAELLAEYGAVSEPVARAMAVGVRERLGGDWGLAVTGIAGPGGGSTEKPVGTVHLAWAGPGGLVEASRIRFPGLREQVRLLSSQVALEGLRRRLLAANGEPA